MMESRVANMITNNYNQKFIVKNDQNEDSIWWDNNKSITAEQFDNLYEDMKAHTEGRELFIQDLHENDQLRHTKMTKKDSIFK